MKRLTSWASQHRSGLLLLLFLAVAAPFSPTITQIIAGNGLTGGGNGGSVTVSLSAPVSIANGGTGSTTGSAAGLNNIPVSYVVQRYATPGTFAITPLPAGAVWVDFSGFGAGSGGGSGRRGTNPSSGGGGGAGGPYAAYGLPASLFTSGDTITIGDGGAGGTTITTDNTNGNDGAPGDDSIVKIGGVNTLIWRGAGKYSTGANPQGGKGGTTTTAGGGTPIAAMIGGQAGRPAGTGAGPILTGTDLGSWNAAGGGGTGGAGGGYNGAANNGGQGGLPGWLNYGFTSGGTAGGSLNGVDAAALNIYVTGPGAGGGASTGDGVTPAGRGGNGIYGSSGGGGGASLNGANSGAGGKGGAALVIMRILCIN